MSDLGRLVFSRRDEEWQARLSKAWVKGADRVEHLDALLDWIADLDAKYEACLLGLPDWHLKTWADRPAIDAAISVKMKEEQK